MVQQKKQSNNENNNNATSSDNTTKQPKERRIVTWTQEEDDILREQISIHGTENWTIIASKFKDKTTRQCRRRWYTYLNSDFKKGGWSPEEDMLLCEAQKIFGNRWTEIAKVVSGRTDNAVKNRFTTLCKKRAKREAMAKENSNAFINVNGKRVLIDSGFCSEGMADVASPLKKLRRAHIPSAITDCNSMTILRKEREAKLQQRRHPLTVLAQNVRSANSVNTTAKEGLIDGNMKTEGTFVRKDDPKVAALVQQAELLSSLAVKVNMENTDQSIENAWKVLQNFFDKNKDSEDIRYKMAEVDLQYDDFKDLMEELRSANEGIQQPQRQPDAYDSPSSSEYSTGSTILSTGCSELGEHSQAEICTMHDDTGLAPQAVQIGDCGGVNMSEIKATACTTTEQEFTSPIQVTPLFRTLATTVPSPQFSESERHFLLRTLGIESPATGSVATSMQPPLCRKALLQGL